MSVHRRRGMKVRGSRIWHGAEWIHKLVHPPRGLLPNDEQEQTADTHTAWMLSDNGHSQMLPCCAVPLANRRSGSRGNRSVAARSGVRGGSNCRGTGRGSRRRQNCSACCLWRWSHALRPMRKFTEPDPKKEPIKMQFNKKSYTGPPVLRQPLPSACAGWSSPLSHL